MDVVQLCVYELLFKETISWCLMCFLGNENLDMWERLDLTSFRFLDFLLLIAFLNVESTRVL